jgi:hypothetical protein
MKRLAEERPEEIDLRLHEISNRSDVEKYGMAVGTFINGEIIEGCHTTAVHVVQRLGGLLGRSP